MQQRWQVKLPSQDTHLHAGANSAGSLFLTQMRHVGHAYAANTAPTVGVTQFVVLNIVARQLMRVHDAVSQSLLS